MKTISVEEEYAKNKDLKPEDVKNLMNWAQKQPHLPKISELEIMLFLHSCYNSQEAAKVTIENYYTCRTHCPEFFENRDSTSPALQKTMDVILYQPLPQSTDRGHRIIFMKIMDLDSSKFVYSDQAKIFIMTMDLWILQEGTAAGHEIVVDLSGMTLSHLAKMSPLTVKKLFYYLQEALPFKLKGLHFFNIVSFMDRFMMLLRPFLKKELFEVIYMYTSDNISDMYKIIPQACLPSDYGGKAPSLKALHAQMKTNLIDNAEYFKQEEINQKVDEKKRLGRAKSAGDIWGVEGSFKKLDLD